MAAVIPLPPNGRSDHRDLAYWMERVLKEAEKVSKGPNTDSVHDLRVALRRCRSLAALMEEIDADPAWAEVRKSSRELFRGLGELRDVHVKQDWVKKLAPQEDALTGRLTDTLERSEKRLNERTLRRAQRFDEKQWRKLSRAVVPRMRFVPPASPAAECLVVERLEDAKELHRRSLRSERAKPWHKLRIGVKRFRYAVEGLLPERYETWEEDLKRVQDLLGDVHDLDVIAKFMSKAADKDEAAAAEAWQAKIEKERSLRVETYRQLALGSTSLWSKWRLGLPTNGNLEKAAWARLKATVRASDPHPRRTAQDARIAKSIFDGLRRSKCRPAFSRSEVKRTFGAAALLHGVRPSEAKKSKRKAATRFLSGATPAGWTREDWDEVAKVIFYSRGKEPGARGGKLSDTSVEARDTLLALAGTLRLSRGLRKAALTSGKGIRVEEAADAIVIHIPGLQDSEQTAGNLASASHLLGRALGKPIVLKAEPIQRKVLVLPAAEPEPSAIAVASD